MAILDEITVTVINKNDRYGYIYHRKGNQCPLEKSVQIDPCRRENVTLFVEIRLTLGDEIKMTPVGILRRGFFCSFRNPSPGTGG